MTATLEKLIEDETTGAREEGRAEGRIDTLISLVSEGLLTISQAAAKAGESEQDFSRRLNQSV